VLRNRHTLEGIFATVHSDARWLALWWQPAGAARGGRGGVWRQVKAATGAATGRGGGGRLLGVLIEVSTSDQLCELPGDLHEELLDVVSLLGGGFEEVHVVAVCELLPHGGRQLPVLPVQLVAH